MIISVTRKPAPQSIAYHAAELSRELARAIGWSDLNPLDPDVVIFTPHIGEPYTAVWFEGAWREFDYREQEVLSAICKRYPCDVSKLGKNYVVKCGDSQAQATCQEVATTLALIAHLKG